MIKYQSPPPLNKKPSGVETHRRNFLKLCTGLTLSLTMLSAHARQPKRGERRLSFYNLHTGESWSKAYWAEGYYLKESLQEINHFLRDYRTGDIYSINRQLLDLLYLLRLKVESRRPFHIISGYRSPATNALLRKTRSGVARKSLHMEGKAIDLRLPAYDLSQLRRAALSLHAGGVGYYPESEFVHLDIGPVRTW